MYYVGSDKYNVTLFRYFMLIHGFESSYSINEPLDHFSCFFFIILRFLKFTCENQHGHQDDESDCKTFQPNWKYPLGTSEDLIVNNLLDIFTFKQVEGSFRNCFRVPDPASTQTIQSQIYGTN